MQAMKQVLKFKISFRSVYLFIFPFLKMVLLFRVPYLLKSDLFTVQILTTKEGFMDVRALTSDASPGLYYVLAGDDSIIRKVFGIYVVTFFFFSMFS